MKKIKIGHKLIGDLEPTFIIAEAGVNHNGDIKIAKKLVDIAIEANADAIKFQTFKAENVVTSEVISGAIAPTKGVYVASNATPLVFLKSITAIIYILLPVA